MTSPLIIAIDGPAAAGKGTLARRLADYYHLNLLDTGLTYRAVAHALLSLACRSIMSRRRKRRRARSTSRPLDRAFSPRMRWATPRRRSRSFPSVRKILVDKQRAFATSPPGAVLDGRDIGTVVCPDADVKLYVTASAEVRARRRLREIEAIGGSGRFRHHPGRHRAPRRARHGPGRLAAEASRRRALA